ncbi:hypothetical protein K7H13_13860 [Qipengyuania citrea]|uniref:hypothetical protein n=1 Tax=Qipengyuania citrea TaxID=225971 RepID=UPI001E56F948|nr:hypothetical protein [Qipengyuania citrea]MCD1591835.1 hypothetical protein [Qipengyuania citrea]
MAVQIKAAAVVLGLLFLKALFSLEIAALFVLGGILVWVWWNEEKHIAFWDNFRSLPLEQAQQVAAQTRNESRDYLKKQIAFYRRAVLSSEKSGDFARAREFRARAEQAESELRMMD